METSKEEHEIEVQMNLRFGTRVRVMGKPATYVYRNPETGGSHPHWVNVDGKPSIYGYRLSDIELIDKPQRLFTEGEVRAMLKDLINANYVISEVRTIAMRHGIVLDPA